MGLYEALDFIANSASKFDILHTLQQQFLCHVMMISELCFYTKPK